MVKGGGVVLPAPIPKRFWVGKAQTKNIQEGVNRGRGSQSGITGGVARGGGAPRGSREK